MPQETFQSVIDALKKPQDQMDNARNTVKTMITFGQQEFAGRNTPDMWRMSLQGASEAEIKQIKASLKQVTSAFNRDFISHDEKTIIQPEYLQTQEYRFYQTEILCPIQSINDRIANCLTTASVAQENSTVEASWEAAEKHQQTSADEHTLYSTRSYPRPHGDRMTRETLERARDELNVYGEERACPALDIAITQETNRQIQSMLSASNQLTDILADKLDQLSTQTGMARESLQNMEKDRDLDKHARRVSEELDRINGLIERIKAGEDISQQKQTPEQSDTASEHHRISTSSSKEEKSSDTSLTEPLPPVKEPTSEFDKALRKMEQENPQEREQQIESFIDHRLDRLESLNQTNAILLGRPDWDDKDLNDEESHDTPSQSSPLRRLIEQITRIGQLFQSIRSIFRLHEVREETHRGQSQEQGNSFSTDATFFHEVTRGETRENEEGEGEGIIPPPN